jgi:hypothetical protein
MLRLHLMFRCQLCCKVVSQRIPAQRVIVRTRIKKYPFRSEANRVVQLTENGKRKEKFVDDPGGVGSEIARELVVCTACAAARGRD